MTFDRFYSTPARQGFHWPGRIVAGEGVLEAWLKDAPGSLAILADQAFVEHPLVVAHGGAAGIVSREPHETDIRVLLAALAARRPHTILALGGGATIDAAKALTAHLRNGTFDIRDRPRDGASPTLIAAPTTAGSGSETSRFFITANADGVKISQRSWSIVPDLTLLDPVMLSGLSPEGLLLGAFDAALHLWETHIARGERSAFTDAIAQAHLPRILSILPSLVRREALTMPALQMLMEASAMAGVAISNVRTGLIHTLGESLAAQCALSHPLTLRVFLRPAVESYAAVIEDHTRPLWAMADAYAPHAAPWSTARFIDAWEAAFAALNLDDRIGTAFSQTPPSPDALVATASRDTTLAKENPAPLSPDLLRLIAASGLGQIAPLTPLNAAVTKVNPKRAT